LPCSSSGGLRLNCVYAASGIVTLCRWLSCAPVKKELFLRPSSHVSHFLGRARCGDARHRTTLIHMCAGIRISLSSDIQRDGSIWRDLRWTREHT
jgi:hypothetical protein